MAKKSSIERNKKRIQLSKKYDNRRADIKKQMKKALSLEETLQIHALLQSLPRNSAANRVNRRCFSTGRPKGVYRDFGLSRHVFREMAHACLLPGVFKASW
ncbi:unnamed protein product [Sphagnum tenellum]|uniref:Small ribosomal subunit protein uS14c n=1 Tax=Cylindrocystis brebissonii TaxID=102167 RepID=A0A191T690_9VIRI|nr:ribosomal protein S14 [Cylindrocystis brebissonii]ANI25892.1 ribosomal protein S14 [Cylindrocystis brebissonii]